MDVWWTSTGGRGDVHRSWFRDRRSWVAARSSRRPRRGDRAHGPGTHSRARPTLVG
ncbi:MAG: hypothetical protein AVDCRST_MAG54-4389 [uncultured Actinomycetospora sp.]|uniref:Uncharacterized protein n=1 Tax=uncultured Actinomycetospora sp. TaxID=1135996 RepID=A0A6J4JXX3_9PSEU|nr:MAG: hypothetical protein AVDCRST_MAG54-4389 [uncultured Actinomycetospora sp.]